MGREIADALYARGTATLVASWARYAVGSPGAALVRMDGVSAAVFPHGPERAVYNNALLDRHLGPRERTEVATAMAEAYASAGVDRYAAWVHESDAGMRAELEHRGFTIEETTRAMGMSLEDISRPRPDAELAPLDWDAYVRYLEASGAPAGLLRNADPSAFHLLGADQAGAHVATGLAFDHAGDCGVYNISTLETARRRGLGTALTTRLLHDAIARGCSTATLQSSPMAERIYTGLGFHDLGRFLEYVPADGTSRKPAETMSMTRGENGH
jgi:ribosomal protein S18 acetylase RimI-like enzyme